MHPIFLVNTTGKVLEVTTLKCSQFRKELLVVQALWVGTKHASKSVFHRKIFFTLEKLKIEYNSNYLQMLQNAGSCQGALMS